MRSSAGAAPQPAAAARIHRLDPLMAEVAAERGITDATLDALFGLTEDTP